MIPKRQYRVLTQEEAATYRRRGLHSRDAYRQGLLLPVGGGSPPDDDGGDDDSDDADDDSDEDDPNPAGGGDDDDDGDDDHVSVPRGEWDRYKRQLAESEKERKRQEREQKKREERERRERGDWEGMLAEKDELVSTVEAERDEARYQLDSLQRNIRVRAVGQRLGLRDPDDLIRYLSEDETEDESTIERAAKRLLRERPYLRSERPSTGMPAGGVEVDGLTIEEIKKWPPEKVNERWEDVQKVLQAQPSGSGRT